MLKKAREFTSCHTAVARGGDDTRLSLCAEKVPAGFHVLVGVSPLMKRGKGNMMFLMRALYESTSSEPPVVDCTLGRGWQMVKYQQLWNKYLVAPFIIPATTVYQVLFFLVLVEHRTTIVDSAYALQFTVTAPPLTNRRSCQPPRPQVRALEPPPRKPLKKRKLKHKNKHKQIHPQHKTLTPWKSYVQPPPREIIKVLTISSSG